MKDKLTTLMAHPAVAHLLRTLARYGNRLGNQFAGAVTYFSVLAMLPVIMFLFATTGFVVTNLRPELLPQVLDLVKSNVGGSPEIAGAIEEALTNWASLGIVSVLGAAYTGAGWIGNLKSAVRAQWRPDFEQEEHKNNIVVETLLNLAILVAFFIMVVLTFGLAQVATSMTDTIIGWMGLDGVGWLKPVLSTVPLVVSAVFGWFLFLFIFRVLPEAQTSPRKAIMKGALAGSILLLALQALAGVLVGSFAGNPAAAAFGPVIILMLFLNLFARLILYIAAWIATSNQPAVARKWNKADEPLRHVRDLDAVEQHWEFAMDDKRETERKQAESAREMQRTISKIKDAVPGLEGEEVEVPTPERATDSPEYAAQRPGSWQDRAAARHRSGAPELVEPQVNSSGEPWAGGIRESRTIDPDAPVDADVARRHGKISLRTGWVFGTATGIGLGALIARILGRR